MKPLTLFGCVVVAVLAVARPTLALDKVTFGTNWLAEAEHGGYYQAIADGTYAKYGLAVTIRQGGPQAANRNLLIAGRIDFYMGSTLGAFDAVAQGIPIVTVAAIFQRDPAALLAHPDQGLENFSDLARLKTIFMGQEGFTSFFTWMKATYPGFSDAQFKPYQFNPGPFIADNRSAQQGYVTSEPYAVQKQGGFVPKIFLLADNGYTPYAATIEALAATVAHKPDVVQRFIDATAIGWAHYLYGDNSAANALIKAANPDMTDDQIAFSLAKMKAYGLVVSGDAAKNGIGCMTNQRYASFYTKMAAAGVVSNHVDYKKAYTLQFVCKKVGLDLLGKL